MKTVVAIIFVLVFFLISVFCWMAVNHNLKYYSFVILETFAVFSAIATFLALILLIFLPKMLIVLKYYFKNILEFTLFPAKKKFLKWLVLHEKIDNVRLNYRAV